MTHRQHSEPSAAAGGGAAPHASAAPHAAAAAPHAGTPASPPHAATPRVAATVPHASATPRTATPRAAAPAPTRLTCFARALRAEALKGKRGGARKVALVAPLPFCLLGLYSSGVLGGGAIGGFATVGWNYWYALMLPIAVSLLTASVANRDARQKLRPVLGLPLPPACVWWAKVACALALAFAANLVVLAASILARHAGSGAPSLPAGLAICVFLTLASAWMVPAGLALATRLGTLAGIALPALVQLGCGIALWSSGLWYLFPPATALRAVSPLAGVAPSGVPLAAGDPLGTFGWQTGAGLAIAAALFAALACAGARWFARREAA